MAVYTVKLSSGTLNLRSNPSLSGSVVTSIPNGATVNGILILPYRTETVTVDNMDWRSVEYNGKQGWVASTYLVNGGTYPGIISQPPLNPTPTYTTTNNTTATMSEQSTGFFASMSEATKKKMKIGGALLLGALTIGVGIYLKNKQKPSTAALNGFSSRKRRKKSKSKSKKEILELN